MSPCGLSKTKCENEQSRGAVALELHGQSDVAGGHSRGRSRTQSRMAEAVCLSHVCTLDRWRLSGQSWGWPDRSRYLCSGGFSGGRSSTTLAAAVAHDKCSFSSPDSRLGGRGSVLHPESGHPLELEERPLSPEQLKSTAPPHHPKSGTHTPAWISKTIAPPKHHQLGGNFA